jgi:hypothetical protein
MNLDIFDYFNALNENYILLLTSNIKEKTAINNVIEKKNNLNIGKETLGCRIGLINDQFVVHITGASGISFTNSLGRIISSIFENKRMPSPALILLTGICWGNPEYVNHGDIIISTSVCSLNSSVIEKDSVTYKDKTYDSNLSIDDCKKDLLSISNTIKIGRIGSLEAKYASSDKRNHLLKQYPLLYGGEMEAFGFIPSVTSKIPWLIVKSVSDYGDDDFNQDHQQASALIVSNKIPNILAILSSIGLVNLKIISDDQLALKSTLLGDTLSVYRKNIPSDALNDYLNDHFGPDLLWKLKSYSTEPEYNEYFADDISCLLLELIQNSFKYGEADNVVIHFYCDKIVVKENGNPYDLNKLTGSNGGSRAWYTFKNKYIDNGSVSYRLKSNLHNFVFKLLDNLLIEIKSKCTARVRRNAVGSGYRSSGVLEYDESCKAVYIDVRNVIMRSRGIIIAQDIKKLMDDGKVVLVACKSKQQEKDFRVDLGPDTDHLRIFVD